MLNTCNTICNSAFKPISYCRAHMKGSAYLYQMPLVMFCHRDVFQMYYFNALIQNPLNVSDKDLLRNAFLYRRRTVHFFLPSLTLEVH